MALSTDFDRVAARSVAVGTKGSEVDLKANNVTMLTHYSSGAQSTGTKKFQWLVPVAGTIVGVRAYEDTAPTGAATIIDVNKNGTTVFTTQANRPTVAISGNASTTTLPDVVTVAAGDRVSYDIDQIGSGVAGSDLTVAISISRSNVDPS